MRILQVNKFLYRRAGAEAYVLDLVELLKQQGEEVTLWGCRLPCHSDRTQRVEESRESKNGIPRLRSTSSARDDIKVVDNLLVDPLNFDQREGLWRDLKKFGHMVWSQESARKFEQVLCDFKPEVVHIHNIYHHISPSILSVAARYGVPVVMTVHDWHLINPNYNFFDHGEICERNGLAAIAHRCIKNSYVASLADVVEWRVHRWMRVYEKYVAKFIVPNEFVKRKLTGSGIPHEKIIHLPLPVILNGAKRSEGSRTNVRGSHAREIPRFARNDKGVGYVLYAGRLTVEKGIYVLLELAKQLPEIKFKIAGDGPEVNNVECRMKNAELKNVELLGFLEKGELQRMIAGARLVLVPSLCEELSPLSVLEAMATGKVVVGSKIGGIAELIQDGKTGFLVTPPTLPPPTGGGGLRRGAWIDTIRKLYYDEALIRKVGKAAKEYVERVHNPEKHYEKIMAIYNRAIGD